MLEHKENVVKITCDKCGKSDEANKDRHNEIFYFLGWALIRGAKELTHLCENCKPKKPIDEP